MLPMATSFSGFYTLIIYYQHLLLIRNYEIGSFKVSTEVWLIKQLVIIDFYRLN